jgi:hypothetical protein
LNDIYLTAALGLIGNTFLRIGLEGTPLMLVVPFFMRQRQNGASVSTQT